MSTTVIGVEQTPARSEPAPASPSLAPSTPAIARRVLILVENNSVPSDRRVWSIATTLARAGYEVEVICPQGARESEQATLEVRDGVRINRFRLAPAAGGATGYLREYATALWRTWRIVRRLTRERSFDVVHSCNPPDFLMLAAWPARRAGARIVFDHHDLTPELFRARFGSAHRMLHRVTLAVEHLCFRTADVVLATNESYREVALTRGRKRPEQVFVVRNGPDLRRFRPRDPDPGLRCGQRHLVGYAGMMAPQDGVDHALHALAILAKRRQDWHAVFAGEGESRPELMRLAGELGLLERVRFVGWLNDEQMATLLCSCDLCLAPEPYTPLNDASTMIKIAEYMAMSRPVVAYALRESRFAAGAAASYARPDDVDSLAQRIDELLDDPERRARMGQAGRERVERELSWEHSERNLVSAYGSVLEPALRKPRGRSG
jgi:glycosyltransferase involved in cell wall biosynthesis